MELHHLESCVAIRTLHHRNLRPDALEPHDAVHPAALGLSVALQSESELDEELSRRCKVVNDDADAAYGSLRRASASFGKKSSINGQMGSQNEVLLLSP